MASDALVKEWEERAEAAVRRAAYWKGVAKYEFGERQDNLREWGQAETREATALARAEAAEAERDALAARVGELRGALSDAAGSLVDTLFEVRQYAASRAREARAALAPSPGDAPKEEP